MDAYIFEYTKDMFFINPGFQATDIFNSAGTHVEAQSQVVIQREGNSMYYAFIRRIDDTNCFGIGVALQGRYLKKLSKVFSCFEDVFLKIATQGFFLKYTSTGVAVRTEKRILDHSAELAILEEHIIEKFDNLPTEALPPLNFSYSINSKKYFGQGADSRAMEDASHKFATTIILKDVDYFNKFSDNYFAQVNKLKSEINAQNETPSGLNDKLNNGLIKEKTKKRKSKNNFVSFWEKISLFLGTFVYLIIYYIVPAVLSFMLLRWLWSLIFKP